MRAQHSLPCLPLGPRCPFLQIVNEYGKDHILTNILKSMDVFVEIVSNPDGFAFTHSMVRASGKEGVGVSSGKREQRSFWLREAGLRFPGAGSSGDPFTGSPWGRWAARYCSCGLCPLTSLLLPRESHTVGSLCSDLCPHPGFNHKASDL